MRRTHQVLMGLLMLLELGGLTPGPAAAADCCDCSAIGQQCLTPDLQGCGAGCPLVSGATCDGVSGQCLPESVVDVPGPNAPTIQAAIDSLPNGGTVRIAAGTYKEHLVISGKQIVLEGVVVANTPKPKLPTIKGTDSELAAVTYQSGGGGIVRNLALQGGGYGIAAGIDLDAQQGEPATTLYVDAVSITKSGRGIHGSFQSLTVVGTIVSKNRTDGLSIGKTRDLLIDGVEVRQNAGRGLILDNLAAPVGASNRRIVNSIFRQNGGGGIEIVGGALPVEVTACTVIENKIAGMTLIGTQSTTISTSSFSFNKRSPKWGDGVRIFGSGPVAADNVTVTLNERAGLSAFGCVGGATSVTLANSSFTKNGFHLETGQPAGCTAGMVDLLDGGGNVCNPGEGDDGTTCRAVSAGLAPLTPPAKK